MTGTAEKTQALWERFEKTRDTDARNELVMSYLHLVKFIARRLLPTYHKHVELDDLMSSGLLGLMDAIDKFDPSKEVKFETYATLRIRGEIIDQIRKQDWAPISLRQKIKRIENGYAELEGKLGRSVTEREVAGHLNMSEDDVKKTLDESHTFNVMCLDEVLVDRMKSSELLISREETPEESLENQEMLNLLAKYIDTLGEKERLVISLYYYEELTLKEIGLTLGVTESRVSQIHSKAMMTLRGKLTAAINA
ncbi:MAG: FliA/WhiG family RNA polymerase sigma factor [Oscillospiraceae bacterium]|nr:FliA/WhiG family RNA polymerase sigma factor [Oscillospiraceae bacterium]